MCHENEMGAAKEQHPYIICRLDKQRRWNSGGTVTRPLFRIYIVATLLTIYNFLISLCLVRSTRIVLRPVNTGALRPTTKIGVKSTGAAIIR